MKDFASDPRVVAYGKGSVLELFEKVSAADLVIAPDSFALHLASLYDVPAIGYFGPAHPHRFSAHRGEKQQPLPPADVFPVPTAKR